MTLTRARAVRPVPSPASRLQAGNGAQGRRPAWLAATRRGEAFSGSAARSAGAAHENSVTDWIRNPRARRRRSTSLPGAGTRARWPPARPGQRVADTLAAISHSMIQPPACSKRAGSATRSRTAPSATTRRQARGWGAGPVADLPGPGAPSGETPVQPVRLVSTGARPLPSGMAVNHVTDKPDAPVAVVRLDQLGGLVPNLDEERSVLEEGADPIGVQLGVLHPADGARVAGLHALDEPVGCFIFLRGVPICAASRRV